MHRNLLAALVLTGAVALLPGCGGSGTGAADPAGIPELGTTDLPDAVVADDITSRDAATTDDPGAGADIPPSPPLTYPVVDTAQVACYDASAWIACPVAGEAFFGQDAQFAGPQPDYTTSSDGLTVQDNVTGLTWQQGYESFKNWADAKAVCVDLNSASLGGYTDWRLPTIKELYSLWNAGTGWPYLDANTLAYDPQSSPHMIIWSSTRYLGLLESTEDPATGAEMAFGVNFSTGHIKAYAIDVGPTHFARCVRGAAYGVNDLVENGDGTITDRATGLMWAQADSGAGMDWEHALAYIQTQNAANALGHGDWRLPSAKELQSLVDYTRSPGATDAARVGPAIDPMFTCTPTTNEAGDADYPYYWTSTSAIAQANEAYVFAWYVAFGRAVGADGKDLHGAGAVRFDAKVPGQSGGESRYYNYVRLVRGGDATPVVPEGPPESVPESADVPGVDADSGPGTDLPPPRDATGDVLPGPTPCGVQSDCAAAGACPPDATKGCTCTAGPQGTDLFCIPACSVDADCPKLPDRTLVCGTEGVCVPKQE